MYSSNLLRLCDCKIGEVSDDANAKEGSVLLGSAVKSQWLGNRPTDFIILHTSGVLRLWNTIENTFRDLALYIPSAGLPIVPNPHSKTIPDRRYASPITTFVYIPPVSKTDELGGIMFTVRGSRKLFGAEIVTPFTVVEEGSSFRRLYLDDHYLSGSIVNEYSFEFPDEITTIETFLMPSSPVAPLRALVVGCKDGSIHLFLHGTPANVEPAVSSSVGPSSITSKFVKDNLISEYSTYNFFHKATIQKTFDDAHNASIQFVKPLFAPILEDNDGSLPVSHHVYSAAQDFYNHQQITTCFLTIDSTGRVKCWSLLPNSHPLSIALAARTEGSDSGFTLHYLFEVPNDTVQITSCAVVAYESTILERKGNSRFLVLTGNREGTVVAWEVFVPHIILHHGHRRKSSLSLVNSKLSLELALAAAAQGVHVSALSIPFLTVPKHATTLRPTMKLSHLVNPVLPTPVIIGLVEARPMEVITALAVRAPRNELNTNYEIVVGASDGTLSVFELRGALSQPSTPVVFYRTAQQYLGKGPMPSPSQKLVADSAPEAAYLSALAALTDAECDPGSPNTSTLEEITPEMAVLHRFYQGDPMSPTQKLATALTTASIQRLEAVVIAAHFNVDTQFKNVPDEVLGALCAVTANGDIRLWHKNFLPGYGSPNQDNAKSKDQEKGTVGSTTVPINTERISSQETHKPVALASNSLPAGPQQSSQRPHFIGQAQSRESRGVEHVINQQVLQNQLPTPEQVVVTKRSPPSTEYPYKPSMERAQMGTDYVNITVDSISDPTITAQGDEREVVTSLPATVSYHNETVLPTHDTRKMPYQNSVTHESFQTIDPTMFDTHEGHSLSAPANNEIATGKMEVSTRKKLSNSSIASIIQTMRAKKPITGTFTSTLQLEAEASIYAVYANPQTGVAPGGVDRYYAKIRNELPEKSLPSTGALLPTYEERVHESKESDARRDMSNEKPVTFHDPELLGNLDLATIAIDDESNILPSDVTLPPFLARKLATSSASSSESRSSRSFLHPAFRSPARVFALAAQSSTVARQSEESSRREVLSAHVDGNEVVDTEMGDLYKSSQLADSHPNAVSQFSNQPAPNAPALASSANILIELERLKNATFDWNEAASQVLQRRRVTDKEVYKSVQTWIRNPVNDVVTDTNIPLRKALNSALEVDDEEQVFQLDSSSLQAQTVDSGKAVHSRSKKSKHVLGVELNDEAAYDSAHTSQEKDRSAVLDRNKEAPASRASVGLSDVLRWQYKGLRSHSPIILQRNKKEKGIASEIEKSDELQAQVAAGTDDESMGKVSGPTRPDNISSLQPMLQNPVLDYLLPRPVLSPTL